MKRLATTLFAAATFTLALGLATSFDAEAGRRLGGGKSFGMSRDSAPMKQAPTAAPASPAQGAAPANAAARQPGAAAPAAQPSGMSRWMGPIAGLAAGLGIAALLSHFGLGEGMANILMIALLAFAAIFVIRLIFRKKQPEGQMQYAGAGAPYNEPARFEPLAGGAAAGGASAASTAAANVPADFDSAGFLRQAKLNFNRLQAANDRGDMDDIKAFTTPEMYAEIKMQYDERGRAAQQTDVVQLNADLIEVVTEGNRHIASVRFFGQLRENEAPQDFNEAWHLVKAVDGSTGWQVAGIQQF